MGGEWEKMVVDVNKLPYQVSDFRTLIDQSRIYVDKTDLVAQLALGVGPVRFFYLAQEDLVNQP